MLYLLNKNKSFQSQLIFIPSTFTNDLIVIFVKIENQKNEKNAPTIY